MHRLGVVVAIVILALFTARCVNSSTFVGKWQTDDGRETREFLEDGHLVINGVTGSTFASSTTPYTWRQEGTVLLTFEGMRKAYDVSLVGDELVLRDRGPSGQVTTLHRVREK